MIKGNADRQFSGNVAPKSARAPALAPYSLPGLNSARIGPILKALSVRLLALSTQAR
jgi:hypothetical protein